MPNYRLEKNSEDKPEKEDAPEPKEQEGKPIKRPKKKPQFKGKADVVPNPAAALRVRRRIIKNNNKQGNYIRPFSVGDGNNRIRRFAMARFRKGWQGAEESFKPQRDHDIGQMVDIHEGKMAIIGGNGPCADMYDMGKIKDYITIAVNANLFSFDPTYWLWVDPRYSRDEELRNSKSTKFKCTWHFNQIPDGIISFGDGRNISTVRRDFYGTLYCISGVIQPAMHLAWIMGCDPIVVIAAPQATVGEKDVIGTK
jgi:hypothetical protein